MNQSERNNQSERIAAPPDSQQGAGKEGKALTPPAYGIKMADFPGVKLHRNSSQATNIGARAFARGNAIHFAPGEYQPSTQKGQHLIQHELTHVAQQREKSVTPTDTVKGFKVNNDVRLEGEANQVAEKGTVMERFAGVSNSNVRSTDVLQAEWVEDDANAWHERVDGLQWYKHTIDETFDFDMNQEEAEKAFSTEELVQKIKSIGGTYRTRTEWLDISGKIGVNLFPPDTTKEQIEEFHTPTKEVEKKSWEEKLDDLLDDEEKEESIDEDHGVVRYEAPTIASIRNPQYTPDGAYAWTVEMETHVARDEKTFIIQEILVEEYVGHKKEIFHFWEAFKVPPNKKKAKHRDVYQSHLHSKNCRVKGTGKMQLLSLTNEGKVPKPLVKGGAEYSDNSQLSSVSAPQGWVEGEGTVHNLFFTLKEGVLQEHGTVPDTDEWEKKNHHTELNTG